RMRRRRKDSSICRMPASRPLVQTLVAKKRFFCTPSSAARSPATVSDRPYIGEESRTVPPARTNSWSTARSGSRAALVAPTSKVCQVPRPMAGSSSPVFGTAFRMIESAIAGAPLKTSAPAPATARRKPRRETRSQDMIQHRTRASQTQEPARRRSDAHFVFGFARPLFDARNAAPIARHPEFRQAAEDAERNGERHDEVPQRLAEAAEKRHQGGDDLGRGAAEDRAHEKPGEALDAVLGRVDAPKNRNEKSQERRQAKREDRAGFAPAQRRLFEFLFLGLAADADIAADHARQVVNRAVNTEIGAQTVPVRRGLGLKLEVGCRLGQERLQLRAGAKRDPMLLARRDHHGAAALLSIIDGQRGAGRARDAFDGFAVGAFDRQHHDVGGGLGLESMQPLLEIVQAGRRKNAGGVVDGAAERRQLDAGRAAGKKAQRGQKTQNQHGASMARRARRSSRAISAALSGKPNCSLRMRRRWPETSQMIAAARRNAGSSAIRDPSARPPLSLWPTSSRRISRNTAAIFFSRAFLRR